MRKRNKMSRSGSRKSFTHNAVKVNRKNNVRDVIMRGGIRF